MLARSQRLVVCAALRAEDGDILLGIRHYSPDMHRNIEARAYGEKFLRLSDENQGFVDQWGKYMSREEAYTVALEAGQIRYQYACSHGRLYSEALY